MTSILDFSPVQPLFPDSFCGHRGELGLVVSEVGVGKSTLLTHIGLHTLINDGRVLHVSLSTPQGQIRVRYDEVIKSLEHSSGMSLPPSTLTQLERQRLIQAQLGQEFDLAYCIQRITLLVDLLDFQPDVILIDAWADGKLDSESLHLWKQLAEQQTCRIWMGVDSASVDSEHLSESTLYLQTDENQLILSQGKSSVSLTSTRLLRQGSEQINLSPDECTLFSGGTTGSESYFGEIAEQYGLREVHFTFEGHAQERNVGSTMLNEHELGVGSTSLAYVSRVLNRSWTRTQNLQRVLQVQWHLVSHSDQLFVVGTIQPDGTVHGGTGWSVELAKRWHKDAWVFDQTVGSWFNWNGTAWSEKTPVITRKNIAATGTRFLNTKGKVAIRELFENNFSQ